MGHWGTCLSREYFDDRDANSHSPTAAKLPNIVVLGIDVKNVFYVFFYFKIKNAFLTFFILVINVFNIYGSRSMFIAPLDILSWLSDFVFVFSVSGFCLTLPVTTVRPPTFSLIPRKFSDFALASGFL